MGPNRERRRPVADSYAMEAASNMHSCVYRTGYDVSLPLGPEGYFHSLAKISPLDRNFFLTTKVGTGWLEVLLWSCGRSFSSTNNPVVWVTSTF